MGFRSYGGSIFLGGPFVAGLISAVVANRMEPRARLEGTGVGAVRHCEFTTGAFVEPITPERATARLGT